jgi:hypothetical protein
MENLWKKLRLRDLLRKAMDENAHNGKCQMRDGAGTRGPASSEATPTALARPYE